MNDYQLSLDDKIYKFNTSRAKFNVFKLFENDPAVNADAALKDLVTGKKFAMEQKAKKTEEKYDEDLVYSRFVNLRRRFSEEDEPIVLGPSLKEKTLPANDKCGIQLWGLGYWSAGEQDEDYDSEEGLEESEMLEIQEMAEKIEKPGAILD